MIKNLYNVKFYEKMLISTIIIRKIYKKHRKVKTQ